MPIDPSWIFSYCFPWGGKPKTTNPYKQKHPDNNKTPPQNQTKPNYAITWFLSLDASQYLAYPRNESLDVTIMQLFASTLFPAVTPFICIQN